MAQEVIAPVQHDPTDDDQRVTRRRGRPMTYADLEWIEFPEPVPVVERGAAQKAIVRAVQRAREGNPSLSLRDALERTGHGEVSERSFYRWQSKWRDLA